VALFWFHPAAWLARREIRSAQEMCCDALVVDLFAGERRSRRRYADTLLASLDFVSAEKPLAPVLASEFGELLSLRRRFEMLANSKMTHRWSWPSAAAVLAMAALLPAGLTFGQPPATDAPPADAPAITLPVPPADDAPQVGLELDVVPVLKAPVKFDDPAATAADAPAISFTKESAGDAGLVMLDTGKTYLIRLQGGEAVVGEVVRQDATWKAVRRPDGQTITINMNHVQSYQEYPKHKDRSSKKAADGAQLGGDTPEMISVAIAGDGQITIDGHPVRGDKMVVDALRWAAEQRKTPAALDITIDASASQKQLEELMALSGKSGLKIARVMKVAPGAAAKGPADEKDVVIADVDKDGNADIQFYKKDAQSFEKDSDGKTAKERDKAAKAKALDDAKLKLMHDLDLVTIKKHIEAMSLDIEKLKAELAHKNDQLKEAEAVIQKLKQEAGAKEDAVKP
jgi:hypothetical protein